METKNEILRIYNDGKVFLHGKLVDKKDVKEVLSTLVNYVPEQEVQEELPKKGQVVWGRHDVNDTWSIGHFIKKEEDLYFLSEDNDDECFYPIKELTTKNPYEVEEDREPQIGDMVFAWDDLDEQYVSFGKLSNIADDKFPYFIDIPTPAGFKHCSLKNPLEK